MEKKPLNAGRRQRRVDSMGEVHETMKEKRLKCWEEFEDASLRAISDTRELGERAGMHVDYPLFRGVRDSTKSLQSSLDKLGKATTPSEYHHTIKVVHKHIETVTGKKWNLNTQVPPGVPPGDSDLPTYEFIYNIPMSEQKEVLRELDLMNITAYSLFGSELSLMDPLAIRELVLEK
jgi:hypothetical protein